MNCPHCGGHLLSTQQQWQERMKALGRCQRCGVEKPAGDTRTYCGSCRLKHAAASRRRYIRRRGAGLRGAI